MSLNNLLTDMIFFLFCSCREEDDGNFLGFDFGSQPPADFKSIKFGQHHIQKDQIRRRADLLRRLLPTIGHIYVVADFFKKMTNDI